MAFGARGAKRRTLWDPASLPAAAAGRDPRDPGQGRWGGGGRPAEAERAASNARPYEETEGAHEALVRWGQEYLKEEGSFTEEDNIIVRSWKAFL